MRITSPKILKGQTITEVNWELSESDKEYIKKVNELTTLCRHKYDEYEMRAALDVIPRIWDLVNKITTDYEPWKLKNDDSTRNKAVYLVLEAVRILSILLYPSLNKLMEDVHRFLGINPEMIKTENLEFRVVEKATKAALKQNFAFEEGKEWFLKINLDHREKVFQTKLGVEPEKKA